MRFLPPRLRTGLARVAPSTFVLSPMIGTESAAALSISLRVIRMFRSIRPFPVELLANSTRERPLLKAILRAMLLLVKATNTEFAIGGTRDRARKTCRAPLRLRRLWQHRPYARRWRGMRGRR